jgi:hypothetical protein
LVDCFAGRAFRVFELTLAAALLAEVTAVQQFIPDLLERQTTAGSVFGPRHVRAVKITAIGQCSVELFKRSNSRMPYTPASPFWGLLAPSFLSVVA